MLPEKPLFNTFLSLCNFLSGTNLDDPYATVAQNSSDETTIILHIKSLEDNGVPVFINQWVHQSDHGDIMKDIQDRLGAFMKFVVQGVNHSDTWTQLVNIGWVHELKVSINSDSPYVSLIPFKTDIFYVRLSAEPVKDPSGHHLWIFELSLATIDLNRLNTTPDDYEKIARDNEYLQSVKNSMSLPADLNYSYHSSKRLH